MKNIILVAFLAFIGLTSEAQVRDTVQPLVNQGNTFDIFGTMPTSLLPGPGNPMPATAVAPTCIDSLQVSDTIAAIIPVNHTNDIDLFSSWYWLKVGSGTATITASYWQSNDGANWRPVIKGVLDSAYTRIFTLSASGWNYIDTKVDTARFTGRFLKIQLMTSSTASVGGRVYMRTKTTLK
jgi:hypothetical protein